MKFLVTFLLNLLVIAPSWSQENDHQIKLDELDFLVGNWKIDANTRLSANGPWEKTEATSIIRKTLNATLIEEELTGTRENKPFLTKTIFALNNATNKYQRVFADSEHGVLIEFEGEKNNDSIYFDKTWIYANGSSVKLKVIYQILSKDEFLVINMRMPQNATEWDRTGRMKYTRMK